MNQEQKFFDIPKVVSFFHKGAKLILEKLLFVFFHTERYYITNSTVHG
ncbi:protein of unknown function [Streptococcus thermophilus]|uniref:Uncharacterized protein n=1 Tax=Streptococcus thermophilus TaxID=1308 RepID=A0AAU9H8Z8_STRTR|nr:protein of unknown function [Streptococcus thermophilus]